MGSSLALTAGTYMALRYSQEWLPPASEEGRDGEPGVLEFRDWGRREEDFRPPALVASPIWRLSFVEGGITLLQE